MTTPDKTRLAELLASATPGPWQVHPEYRTFISTVAGDADITELDGWPMDLRDEEDANRDLIIAAVNSLPALLAENAALEQRVKALEGALTPSADTKAAYIGEIKYSYVEWDEFGDERTVTRTLEWTTTKEVMAMITARAARLALKGTPDVS